jgi:hypothetical protein
MYRSKWRQRESIKAGAGMLSIGKNSLETETEDEVTNSVKMIRNMQLSLNCMVHGGGADEEIYVEGVRVNVRRIM